MRWIPDPSGRFRSRPYYDTEEIDATCEDVVTHFLHDLHGNVCFPIQTNDLTILAERIADDVDLFADLTCEGDGVEGVTELFPARKPTIKIAAMLSEFPSCEKRLRTTITHEIGHAVFHQALVGTLPSTGTNVQAVAIHCRRESMIGASTYDWLEWQAGYASGAFLMPSTQLDERVRTVLIGNHREASVYPSSQVGRHLIHLVQAAFQVSESAARIRLQQRKYLADRATTSRSLTRTPIR